MKTYSESDLKEIIRKHGMWFRGENGGQRASLRGVNLREANLCEADLRGADLRGANLGGADLSEAINGHVCRMDFGGWSICIYEARTSIGCKTHDNADWLSWTHKSPEIIEMHSQASEWWRVHGDAVKAAIRCVMAKVESERQQEKS